MAVENPKNYPENNRLLYLQDCAYVGDFGVAVNGITVRLNTKV
jgi:hypothetical protein